MVRASQFTCCWTAWDSLSVHPGIEGWSSAFEEGTNLFETPHKTEHVTSARSIDRQACKAETEQSLIVMDYFHVCTAYETLLTTNALRLPLRSPDGFAFTVAVTCHEEIKLIQWSPSTAAALAESTPSKPRFRQLPTFECSLCHWQQLCVYSIPVAASSTLPLWLSYIMVIFLLPSTHRENTQRETHTQRETERERQREREKERDRQTDRQRQRQRQRQRGQMRT